MTPAYGTGVSSPETMHRRRVERRRRTPPRGSRRASHPSCPRRGLLRRRRAGWFAPRCSRIVSMSNGMSVRGSISSTEMPSCSSACAASSARPRTSCVATTVTSEPSRTTAALPSSNGLAGSAARPSGSASPCARSRAPDRRPATAARSSAYASAGVPGHGDLQSGNVQEPVLDGLRVLGRRSPRPPRWRAGRSRAPSPGRRSCSGTWRAGWRSGRSRRRRSRRTSARRWGAGRGSRRRSRRR